MAIQQSRESLDATSRAPRRAGSGRALQATRQGAGPADEQTAQGLGWFSVALGAAEVLAPRAVARLSGIPPWTGLLRVFGLREIGAGVGILSERRPTGWMWARVAGDALDLAMLAAALAAPRSRRGRVLAATAAVAGVTALDFVVGRRLTRAQGPATSDTPNGVRVRTAITVNRAPDEVHRYWRNFVNLPRVMPHLESVTIHGDQRSRWVARAPGGMRLTWDAEIVEDRPGELISWRSLPGGDVDTTGSVRFVPGPHGRGTEVYLDMEYRFAAGVLASTVGRWFGGAAGTLAGLGGRVGARPTPMSADLRPLKQILETGQIPTTDGQPSGRAAGGRR